jgi:hypothetical protein
MCVIDDLDENYYLRRILPGFMATKKLDIAVELLEPPIGIEPMTY